MASVPGSVEESLGGAEQWFTVIKLKGLNSAVAEVCCVMPCGFPYQHCIFQDNSNFVGREESKLEKGKVVERFWETLFDAPV